MKTGAILLCAAIAIWCVKRPLRAPYLHAEAIVRSQFGETLVRTSLVQSPIAHNLIFDFAELKRYRAANRSLPPPSSDRVVFYGDSITDFWTTGFAPEFFPGKSYIGRGIAGQSTPELVWRFQPDVINLHPSTVVLLAGTNDVVWPARRLTPQQTLTNIATMVNLAQQNRIRVILCSILPVAKFPPLKQAQFTAKIQGINMALRSFASQRGLPYVDYFSALSDENGNLRPTFSPDGVHPNAAGYAVMETLAQSAIDHR